MSKLILSLCIMAAAALTAGCGSSGVGDPCTLPNPVLPPGTDAGCMAGGGSCFEGSEIYIETRSLQCRTRVCMIYLWDQNTEPGQKPVREFCTCKCGGPGDPSTFCTCPGDFTCTQAFVAGNVGIQGSYCVRNEVLDSGVEAGTGSE